MSLSEWWDKIKNKIPKLVEVKGNLTEKGDVHLNIGGKHYHHHYRFPEDVKPSDVLNAQVTPETEREYLEAFKRFIEAKLEALPSKSEESVNQAIVEASTASAVQVLTPKIIIRDEVGLEEDVTVRLVNGETQSVISPVRSTGPPKKPFGSDEGETM